LIFEKQTQFKANLRQERNLPRPSPSRRDEAATRRRPADKKGDLKKQSQFVPAQMGVKSFMKGNYDNKPAGGAEKNKAKQIQFLYRRPDSSLIMAPIV
jgi:hypothetical protein